MFLPLAGGEICLIKVTFGRSCRHSSLHLCRPQRGLILPVPLPSSELLGAIISLLRHKGAPRLQTQTNDKDMEMLIAMI